MPKNFEEFQQKQENNSDYKEETPIIDPNLYLNDITYQEIRKKNLLIFTGMMIGKAISTLITAPLTTLQVSLQLSVLQHQNKYGDMNEFEKKDIMKVPKELTAYDKRRYELIVKSGVTGANKPFRAPVYLNYKEAFKALQNQGILGFYKGNFVGLAHFGLTSFAKFSMINGIDRYHYENPGQESKAIKAFFTFFTTTLIDMAFNPLQLIQSRFILQNRLQNFRTYSSAFHVYKKHKTSPYIFAQGWRVHFPKNILLTAGYFRLPFDNPFVSFMFSNILAETLIYPLTTVLRRLQCQDKIAGMLPERYSGAWHAFKLIMYEEGIRGLFRGYMAFLPALMIQSTTLLMLQITGETAFSLKALEENNV